MSAKLNTRFFLLAFLALFTFCAGCKTNSSRSETSNLNPTQIPAQPAQPTPVPNPVPHLVCPPLETLPVEPPQSPDGHRVTLSWKASHADAKHAGAVGYCIYRGTKKNDPPSEQVNALPYTGVSCVDDSVKNGNTYYYVVLAINFKGVTSITSKPAPAVIPSTPRDPSSPVHDAAPLCRVPSATTTRKD
jgi:hypothetical protein